MNSLTYQNEKEPPSPSIDNFYSVRTIQDNSKKISTGDIKKKQNRRIPRYQGSLKKKDNTTSGKQRPIERRRTIPSRTDTFYRKNKTDSTSVAIYDTSDKNDLSSSSITSPPNAPIVRNNNISVSINKIGSIAINKNGSISIKTRRKELDLKRAKVVLKFPEKGTITLCQRNSASRVLLPPRKRGGEARRNIREEAIPNRNVIAENLLENVDIKQESFKSFNSTGDAKETVIKKLPSTVDRSTSASSLFKHDEILENNILILPANEPIEHKVRSDTDLTERGSKVLPRTVKSLVEQALENIKGQFSENELVLFVSHTRDSLMSSSSTVQVAVADRETKTVLGTFSLDISVLRSAINYNQLKNYTTIFVSQSFNSEEKSSVGSAIDQLSKLEIDDCNYLTAVESVAKTPIVKNPEEYKKTSIFDILKKLKKSPTDIDLDRLFEISEIYQFYIYAYPDYRSDDFVYFVMFYTSNNDYLGWLRMSDQDILIQLEKFPLLIPSFKMVRSVGDIMLPRVVGNIFEYVFNKLGLIYIYDCMGSILFSIFSGWSGA